MFLGMKLAEYLATNKISQADFAQLIQAKQVTVSRYVTGRRMPRRDRLERIREATGGAVSADDFLSEAAE
jgi:transcriptional regulator with XRE-family HTH domain